MIVVIGGVAWAQHTGIAKVEVRLDGGDWQEMSLGATMNNDTWVQWAGTISVPQGSHKLAVRATDKSGYTQTGGAHLAARPTARPGGTRSPSQPAERPDQLRPRR